jgi:hypothetical protein
MKLTKPANSTVFRMNQKENTGVEDKTRPFRDGRRSSSLSGTQAVSLQALKEHNRELVFESRGQALRMLLRARKLDRYTAGQHVMLFWARGLIRIEKMKEGLQPWLFEVPAELRHRRRAPAERTSLN